MEDTTRKFTALDSKTEMKEILSSVYNSLMVKGYNPINQIVGYILSEDPTYITNYNNARTLITRIDRDELLQELVRTYLFFMIFPRRLPPCGGAGGRGADGRGRPRRLIRRGSFYTTWKR